MGIIFFSKLPYFRIIDFPRTTVSCRSSNGDEEGWPGDYGQRLVHYRLGVPQAEENGLEGHSGKIFFYKYSIFLGRCFTVAHTTEKQIEICSCNHADLNNICVASC